MLVAIHWHPAEVTNVNNLCLQDIYYKESGGYWFHHKPQTAAQSTMTVFDHLVAFLLIASSVVSLRLPEFILPGVSWSQHADEHPALQALSDNSTVQNSRPLIGILSQVWFIVRILSDYGGQQSVHNVACTC